MWIEFEYEFEYGIECGIEFECWLWNEYVIERCIFLFVGWPKGYIMEGDWKVRKRINNSVQF